MKPIKLTFCKDKLTAFAGLKPFLQYVQKNLQLFDLFDSKVTLEKKKRNYTKLDYFKSVFVLFAVGYEKLSHIFLLYADALIHQLLDLEKLPNPENISRCFLNKFTFKHTYELSRVQQVAVSTMHRKLFKLKSATIDLDSSTKDTCGHQEGVGKHYNNGKGHHPLYAFLFETKEFLHGYLRPGDTYTGNNAVGFVSECLARLPYTIRMITLRADSGFFSDALMTLLEKYHHMYLIAAKLYPTLLSRVIDIPGKAYRKFDDEWDIATIHFALNTWEKARKFIILRTLKKASRQTSLLGNSNTYKYQVYCTNRDDFSAEENVVFYRERGAAENYIKEAKSDTRFKFFTIHQFWGNEVLFQIAMLLYNASIWFRAELISKKAAKERLYTFRLKFIALPGRLISSGRTLYLKINTAYRYRSLMEKIEMALA